MHKPHERRAQATLRDDFRLVELLAHLDLALLLARLEALQLGRDLLHRGIADERQVNSPRVRPCAPGFGDLKKSLGEFRVVASGSRHSSGKILILQDRK